VLVGIRLYSDSAVDNGAWEGNPDDYRQAPMDDANLRALDEEELLGREEQEAIRREEAARNAYERKKAEERAAYEARERERLARPVNEGDRGYISILGLSLKTDPVSAMVDGRLMTGMLMGGTLPQSNARAAGLKNGDIIIEVQGDPVASRDDVARGLRRARVDGVGAVTLRVLKGGTDPQFIPVELFPLPIPYD